jgi:septal ring factor EnvC (AmiA/AmiB activator)
MNNLKYVTGRELLEKNLEIEAAQQEDLAKQLLDLENTLKTLDTSLPHTKKATEQLSYSLQSLKDNISAAALIPNN